MFDNILETTAVPFERICFVVIGVRDVAGRLILGVGLLHRRRCRLWYLGRRGLFPVEGPLHQQQGDTVDGYCPEQDDHRPGDERETSGISRTRRITVTQNAAAA